MLRVILFACALLKVAFASFDWQTGNTSLWLSSAAYCDTKTYLTRTFVGPTTGFKVTYAINEEVEKIQGFIGYLPSESSIYVVFRGSQTVGDWAANLNAILTSYPKCSKCEVHKGFYKAQQKVWPAIYEQVMALRAQFPTYTVVVTGHSLGAAMATLTALDLLDKGVSPLRMFHFGSPRVGNKEFATYASAKIVDRNRVTHYKDMVPHVPMHERFTHISGEWYEDKDGKLHECQGFEDDKCSFQWHITSIDDHLHYFGMFIDCVTVS